MLWLCCPLAASKALTVVLCLLLFFQVATEMVQTVVRAWMCISLSKLRPDNMPEGWRDKPNVFRATVIGIRNSRLTILIRMQRYINGKETLETIDRVQRDAKLSKAEKIRQSSLLKTVTSMDPAANLVGGVIKGSVGVGASLVRDTTGLVGGVAGDAVGLAKDTTSNGLGAVAGSMGRSTDGVSF